MFIKLLIYTTIEIEILDQISKKNYYILIVMIK